ncbi:MAG: hypothetical protein M0Q88_07960 [Bacilli bacterium]|nr:hypothetical protein [Bacilli bacterium]
MNSSVLIDIDYPIFFEGKFNHNKQHHLWYKDLVTTINGPHGYDFQIEAMGKVNVLLYEKETKNLLFHAKDSNTLHRELSKHIEGDKELYLLLANNHPKYHMNIINNNWWECFLVDDELNVLNFNWILNAETLLEAINEVKVMINDVLEVIKKGGL